MIERKLINLGYADLFAVISVPSDDHPRSTSPVLTLFHLASTDEQAHTPAQSIELYGKAALVALRDSLLAAFPIEESKP
jgi:hypothetical protein